MFGEVTEGICPGALTILRNILTVILVIFTYHQLKYALTAHCISDGIAIQDKNPG
jgi:hypothetical protein